MLSNLDNTPPVLTSLTIPSVIDLRSGDQTLHLSVGATDVGSGVSTVTVHLDHAYFYTSLGTTLNFFVFSNSSDSFADGVSTLSVPLGAGSDPGVYNITSVDVQDGASNHHIYSPTVLSALGIATSFTVLSNIDNTPPVLTSLAIPSVIDVRSGDQTLHLSVGATDVGTGVSTVTVHLDHGYFYTALGTTETFFAFSSNIDSFADGVSTLSVPFGAGSDPGVYNITSVDVQDGASNHHIYSPTDLSALGIATSFTVGNSTPLTLEDSGAGALSGDIGNDTIQGGSGPTYLRGNGGDDSIQGGSGFDDINGNKGQDTIDGGTGGHDWLVGGQGDDSITGRQADILWGNLGADTLHGGSTAAQLRGGQGDDSIIGGSGNEFISGDRGNDTESGGAGADMFHGSQDAGIDRVLDFNQGEGDRVQLDPGTTYTLTQVGSDTVIDMGAGNQMILVGVQLSSLQPGWIFLG